MPRRKVTRELIVSRRARALTFGKRREGLKKKARELATLCGVRIALVCADGEGASPPDVWEAEDGVVAAYRALPAEVRAAHTHRAYADAELSKEEAKLARVRQGGPPALPLWDKVLDGMGAEEAARVLGEVNAALAAVEDRGRALGIPVVGLLEAVAPLMHAPPPCGGSSFVDVDGYQLGAQGNGDASGGLYEQAMWGNDVQPCSATALQPGYGVHQFPGGGADMDGYQLQLQMAAGMNGHNDTHLAWDAFQPHPGYSSQCYGDMSGYGMQNVPSNGDLPQPNLHNAVVPAQYPSLDIGLGYIDTAEAHNAQGYNGGNFINAPPALPHAMGTGDNFMSPAPVQPFAMYAGGYRTQCPAQQQQQQLQSATSSQQSGIEQLHYFSDVEDTQLQQWGN